MTEVKQVYRCSICGNIVEILNNGVGTLFCCGKPMELLKENNRDAGAEKHVPIIEKTEKGILVKVGSVPHPMEKEHYIQWIEAVFDDRIDIKFLKPKDKPEAEFNRTGKTMSVRIYCNVHGLWKN